MVDIDLSDFDTVILCVAHQLSRPVETHRLRIEDRRAEHIGIIGLEPAGGVDKQRESRSMALGKAVLTKALDLLEATLGKVVLVASFDHAFDHTVAVIADRACTLEGRHGAPELVGLAGREATGNDGDFHRLLLKQRHAHRLAENVLKFRLGIVDVLLALPATEIGMHHVALDGTGPDDRHLDDEIVELTRPEARQHRHLRPALDLEDAERVGPADHVIDLGILRRQRRQLERAAMAVTLVVMYLKHFEGLAQAGQHAERQHVDLQYADGVEVVLVPFDHLALVHRRLDDRHDLVEPIAGDDKAADMLGQVARKPHDAIGMLDHMAGHRIRLVEATGSGFLLAQFGRIPAPDRARHGAPDVVGQTHCLGDFAQRRTAAIGDDGSRERGALGAVFFVDELNDLVAPLVLEVDVDIWRFATFLRDETLEKHIDDIGSDIGDADAKADDRIGGGAAALAEDVLRTGEFHDLVDGEEIAGVVELFDDAELMPDDALHLLRNAIRVAPFRSFPGQPFQFRLRFEA